MSKKKSIILPVFITLAFLVSCAVEIYPFISLQEGSLLDAVLSGLYVFYVTHLGFFITPFLEKFTLVPFLILLLCYEINVFKKSPFVYWLYEGGLFIGLYMTCAYLQGAGAMFASVSWIKIDLWQYFAYMLSVLCLVLMILLKTAEMKQRKAVEKPENSSAEEEDRKLVPLLDGDCTSDVPMTTQEAFDAINSLEVPQFTGFPNDTADNVTNTISEAYQKAIEADDGTGAVTRAFEIANRESQIRREAILKSQAEKKQNAADQEKIRNFFKPRSLRKRLREDMNFQEIPDFGALETSLLDGFEPGMIPEEEENQEEIVLEESPIVDRPFKAATRQMNANHPVSAAPVEQHKAVPDNCAFDETDEDNVSDDYRNIPDESEVSDVTVLEPENDDDLENAKSEYERLKSTNENVLKTETADYTSSVGGLRSSKEGGYLYDSSRFKWNFPSESLLKHYEQSSRKTCRPEEDADGMTIVDTFRQFNIGTELVGVQYGPTFTLYELTLAKGIKVNSVMNLAENLAMDLAVSSVRILAPIPGKSAIGIEVPNKKRDTIGFDLMMPALKAKTFKVPMVLGKTITGESIVIDLAGTPHLLIAGTTGSGKSVCVNSLICSILYTKSPKDVRMILVDPKMVELSVYNDIPHLLTPVITDAKRAIKVMAFIVEEMERRMTMFTMVGARKIEDYNEKILDKSLLKPKLPYIVVIVDEFADLMSVVGKELESYIKRITAMARFTGIHLVLATQRPSADVITGIIKSNIPTQIAFAVSNQINSRIIIDNGGAEKLLGKGDMLFNSPSNRVPVRIQGAYIDPEIEEIVKFIKTQGQPDYIDESYFEDEDDEEEVQDTSSASSSGGEDLYMKAWKIVADRGEASASYLQRRLSIGYNKAANLIEQLEENGCVGPARGSKPREILRYPDSRSEGTQE